MATLQASRRSRHGFVAAALLTVLSACSAADTGAGSAGVASDSTPASATGAPPAADTAPDAGAAGSSVPVTNEASNDSRCAAGVDQLPDVLTVWHSMGGDAEGFLDDLIDEFEEEFPGIVVEAERIDGGYDGALTRLGETPAGEWPDVFMGSPDSVRIQADSDKFVPIDECTDNETPESFTDLLPVIDRTYRLGGRLWAAPFNVSTPVLFYDTTTWDRAGVDSTIPPLTFTDLDRISRSLVASGEVTTGIVMYDRSASWLIEQVASKRDRLLVVPDNGRSGTLFDTVDLGGVVAVELLQMFSNLEDDGILEWIGINPDGLGDLLQLVHPETPSGMTLHTSASIGDVLRLVESGALPDGKLGIGPMPGPPGGLVGGGAWWLVDSEDSQEIGAAWTFVNWMSRPGHVAQMASLTGYVPTTTRASDEPTTVESWASKPIMRVAFEQLRATPDSSAGAGMQVGPMVDARRTIEIAASKVIDAGDDPAVEISQAEETILELLLAYEELAANG